MSEDTIGPEDIGVPPAPGERRIVVTAAEHIQSERLKWAWKGRAPLKSVTVFAGEPGLGKSILTNARLAAEMTRGTLDGDLKGKPRDVLVVTAEDDWAAVVKPRLVAHNADLSRVHRLGVEDDAGEALVTFPDDCAGIAAKVEQLRAQGHDVGMVVIDPIGAFLSSATDSHRDASVRRALAPLAQMAMSHDLVVVVVAHLTKDEAQRLLQRLSGSGAFGAAARSVLILARDPDDPDGEQGRQRVIVHVKTNWGGYAPSIAARIEKRDVQTDDGDVADTGYIEMLGESRIGVEDLQGNRAEANGSEVKAKIRDVLAAGSMPSREVKDTVADELECTPRTVMRHAARMRADGELEATDRDGFQGQTIWRLAVVTRPLVTTRDTDPCHNCKSPIDTRDTGTSEVQLGHVPVTSPLDESETEQDRAERLFERWGRDALDDDEDVER